MARKAGVVVAGTHGKTTTSSLSAHVLRCGGLKPSHYVGAEIPILGTNAHWDEEGELFVAEGDESDGTLINFQPKHAIILNIEPEHLDFYEDIDAIKAVFRQLLEKTSGLTVYCAEDAVATDLCNAGRKMGVKGMDGRAAVISPRTSLSCGRRRRSSPCFEKDTRPRRGDDALGIPGAAQCVECPGGHRTRHALGRAF